jgi:hypothetical protein
MLLYTVRVNPPHKNMEINATPEIYLKGEDGNGKS